MTEIIVSTDRLQITLTKPGNEVLQYRCVLGPAGIVSNKIESDGATPRGRFALRRVLYRPDRVRQPGTGLPVLPIHISDGWCDAPNDPRYNRPVNLPYISHAERLWRDDHLYDICVILGYNDDPPEAGYGSAIFFHLAHDDYRHTEGCVAVSLPDMEDILGVCTPDTYMRIGLD